MTTSRKRIDLRKALNLVGAENLIGVEEYTEVPKYVDSTRCYWHPDDDGIWRCQPKPGQDPCGYCAPIKVRKWADDGSEVVEIHCLCWE